MEEFGRKELESRCRRCQTLAVDDENRTAAILEKNCHIINYDVPEPGIVRVFEKLENFWEVNRELALGGVKVKESYLSGQDLEGYFMDLQGGREHD